MWPVLFKLKYRKSVRLWYSKSFVLYKMRKRNRRHFLIIHIDLNIKLYFINSCLIFSFLMVTMSTSEERPPSSYRYFIFCDQRKDAFSASWIRPAECAGMYFLLQVGSLLHNTQFLCLNSLSSNFCVPHSVVLHMELQ